MAHQHLKDMPTGNPRLSPLQCSLQKTFSCFIYIYTAILPSTGTHLALIQDLLHLELTNLPYKEPASDSSTKSIPQSVNTRPHDEPKKSMGGRGERKKSLQTQSSVTSSQALTLSAPEASLPWQPWHLQPSCQESREGDTCLQFVSWVIGPAVQGHLSPGWQQAMAVCLDTRATLSLEWISGIY